MNVNENFVNLPIDDLNALDNQEPKELKDSKELYKLYIIITTLYSAHCFNEILEILKRNEIDLDLKYKYSKEILSIKYMCNILTALTSEEIEKNCKLFIEIGDNNEFHDHKKSLSSVLNNLFSQGKVTSQFVNKFDIKVSNENEIPENEGLQLVYIDYDTSEKIGALKTSTKIEIVRANLEANKTGIRKMLDDLKNDHLNESETLMVLCMSLKISALRNDLTYGLNALKSLSNISPLTFKYKNINTFNELANFLAYTTTIDMSIDELKIIKECYKTIYNQIKFTQNGLFLLTTFKNCFNAYTPNQFNEIKKISYEYFKNELNVDDPYLNVLKMMNEVL